MTDLVALLDSNRPQRDKLVLVEERIDEIRALRDDHFIEILRKLNRKLNSPKLADELKSLFARLHDGRTPIPVPKPAPPPPPPPRAPPDELEARLAAEILADPNARDPYLPYADYLAAKGDPRGEMINLGRELAKSPGHEDVLRRHTELAPTILGPLAALDDMVENVEWYMGFVARAKVKQSLERFNGDRKPSVSVAAALELLLAGPGRFLQHLSIGVVQRESGNRYDEVTAILAREPRVLRTLHYGDFDREETELNWSDLGNLAPLWPACQDLREVILRGGAMKIGPVSLPTCTSFSTVTGALDAESLNYVSRAAWPELVELNLWLGPDGDAQHQLPTALAPLLAGLPKLRHLAIKNHNRGEVVIELLANSKLLAQLEVLDLSMTDVTEGGIALLREQWHRFAHLKKLLLGSEELEPQELPGPVVWEERYGPVIE